MSEPPASPEPTPADRPDPRRLFDEMAQRLAQLKQWQLGQQQEDEAARHHLEQLEQRAAELEARDAALDERQAQLDVRAQQRAVEVEARGAALDERQAQLDEQAQQRAAEFEARGAALDQRQTQLDERAQHLAEVQEQRRAVEAERQRLAIAEDELRDREEKLAGKQAVFQETVERARGQWETRREELSAEAQAVADQRAEVEAAGAAIKDIVAAIRDRRQRLRGWTRSLRARRRVIIEAERKEQELQARAAELDARAEVLQQEQAALNEQRQRLAAAEKDLAKHWATPNSVLIIAATAACVTLLALASIVVGTIVSQPAWRATADLRWQGDAPAPTLTALLGDDRVREETMRQLSMRGHRPFEQAALLGEHLDENLAAGPGGAGGATWRLVYDHADKALALAMLDALGEAVIRTTPGVAWGTQRPAVDPDPVRDPRWRSAAITFAIALGVLLVLTVILRHRLLRRRRHSAAPTVPAVPVESSR